MAAKTTVKVAIINNAAKDDYYQDLDWLTEDGSLVGTLGVLGNDPGSARIIGWSDSLPTTQAELTSKNPVIGGKVLVSINPLTGELDIDANGLNDSLQHLGAGDTAEYSFYYTAQMANGAYSTAKVTFIVEGANDVATISGDNNGAVTEDDDSEDGGTLSVTDVDDGENVFREADADDLAGIYGDFTFNAASGEWNFTIDNDAAQGLGAGETATETLTVYSLDGTDSETITVTIHGKNDEADIGGVDSGSVTEDGSDSSTGGQLTISDADGEDEESFVPQNSVAGKYGTFTISTSGAWTYELNNDDPDLDDLDTDESDTEEFTVVSEDGTEHVVVITVNGSNEAPSGPIVPGDNSFENDPANDQDDPSSISSLTGAVIISSTSQTNLSNALSPGDKAVGTGTDQKINGRQGDDLIHGGGGDDEINGNEGADTLWGGAGNDKLNGGSGAEFIRGGSGNDVINAGGGADQIWGGTGADIFDYTTGSDSTTLESDHIWDFSRVEGDKIDLTGLNLTWGGILSTAADLGLNQVGYIVNADFSLTVFADTNGDGDFDAGTDLSFNVSGSSNLIATDFVGLI